MQANKNSVCHSVLLTVAATTARAVAAGGGAGGVSQRLARVLCEHLRCSPSNTDCDQRGAAEHMHTVAQPRGHMQDTHAQFTLMLRAQQAVGNGEWTLQATLPTDSVLRSGGHTGQGECIAANHYGNIHVRVSPDQSFLSVAYVYFTARVQTKFLLWKCQGVRTRRLCPHSPVAATAQHLLWEVARLVSQLFFMQASRHLVRDALHSYAHTQHAWHPLTAHSMHGTHSPLTACMVLHSIELSSPPAVTVLSVVTPQPDGMASGRARHQLQRQRLG